MRYVQIGKERVTPGGLFERIRELPAEDQLYWLEALARITESVLKDVRAKHLKEDS